MLDKVELRPAFAFTCEVCGRENLVAAVAAEMSPEDAALVRLELGVDPDQEGVLMEAPRTVECFDCGARFETVEYGEGA